VKCCLRHYAHCRGHSGAVMRAKSSPLRSHGSELITHEVGTIMATNTSPSGQVKTVANINNSTSTVKYCRYLFQYQLPEHRSDTSPSFLTTPFILPEMRLTWLPCVNPSCEGALYWKRERERENTACEKYRQYLRQYSKVLPILLVAVPLPLN